MNPDPGSQLNRTSERFTSAHDSFPSLESGSEGASKEDDYRWIVGFYCSFAVASISIIFSSAMLLITTRLVRNGNSFLLLAANLNLTDIGVAATAITLHTYRYLQLTADAQSVHLQKKPTIEEEWRCAESVAIHLWEIFNGENLLTIFLMTLSNFISFKWPHYHRNGLSKAVVVIAIAVTWLMSASLALSKTILIMVTNGTSVGENSSSDSTYCIRLREYDAFVGVREWHSMIRFSVFGALILLVYITMFFMYVSIFRHVWSTTLHKIRHLNLEEGFTARMRLMRRTTVTTLLIVASLTMFWLPIVIYAALRSISTLKTLQSPNKNDLQMLRLSLVTLVCLSGIIDPILYGIRLPEVRKAIGKVYFKLRNT